MTIILHLLRALNAESDPELLEVLDDQRKRCPRCEAEMVLRTAKRGPSAGGQFWGCSRYPACHYTLTEPPRESAITR